MISFTSDQTFIVTGASSGIGAGVALLLNELGARVVAIARNEQRLNEVRSQSKNPDLFAIEIKDLAEDVAGLPAYVKDLKSKYGKFKGIALCAGISQVLPMKAVDIVDLKTLFEINYFSPIMMTKIFCDKRIHADAGSSVVAISSIASVMQGRGMMAYSGAKAALAASMRSIAKEVADIRVRVNCVSPAMVNTPMAKGTDDFTEVHSHHYPFGFAEVDDIANMVVFLLSDKAKWISGQNYVMDCASY